MKVSKISYSRLMNLGNYEHEKVECEIELDKTDSPEIAVQSAKAFVKKQLGLLPDSKVLNQAEKILHEFGDTEQLVLQLEPPKTK